MSWGRTEKRRKLRSDLRQRDGDDCHICGRPMLFGVVPDQPDFATIDHITPRALGGKHAMDNLKLAHRRCNLARGDALLEEAADGLPAQ